MSVSASSDKSYRIMLLYAVPSLVSPGVLKVISGSGVMVLRSTGTVDGVKKTFDSYVTMTGGTVTGNTTKKAGAGVLVNGEGCHFTLWKDCLTRGGGPEMTDKLVQLLLKQKQLRGSTGTIVLGDQRIAFYPIGSNGATVNRSVIYQK